MITKKMERRKVGTAKEKDGREENGRITQKKEGKFIRCIEKKIRKNKREERRNGREEKEEEVQIKDRKRRKER